MFVSLHQSFSSLVVSLVLSFACVVRSAHAAAIGLGVLLAHPLVILRLLDRRECSRVGVSMGPPASHFILSSPDVELSDFSGHDLHSVRTLTYGTRA